MQMMDKMPAVKTLLRETDSEPAAYLVAAAFPAIIATGIRAYQSMEFSEATLEGRIAWIMNSVAAKVLEEATGVKPGT